MSSGPGFGAPRRGKDRVMTTDFPVTRTTDPLPEAERAALLADPGFGRIFTDHMVTIRYSEAKGWYDARLEPFGPLSALARRRPRCTTRRRSSRGSRPTGSRRRRSHSSARRPTRRGSPTYRRPDGACRPCPKTSSWKRVWTLLDHDRDWVPAREGMSLYLRPFMFATDPFLGVRPSRRTPLRGHRVAGRRATSPARAVRLDRLDLAGLHARRARRHRGGQGGGQLRRQPRRRRREAIEAGCDQVVFLDAVASAASRSPGA